MMWSLLVHQLTVQSEYGTLILMHHCTALAYIIIIINITAAVLSHNALLVIVVRETLIIWLYIFLPKNLHGSYNETCLPFKCTVK